LVLPMYPQYSGSTTGSTFDEVSRVLRDWRWLPDFRMLTAYHDQPGYIDTLAASIRAAWGQQPPARRLLMSFHGLPKYFLEQGDPYHCQCHKTARLLAEKLALPDDRWSITFQSRFGKAEWLQPYTDKTLEKLAGEGLKDIDVVCPGFPADCLETLEEMAITNRQVFLDAGGEHYRYIPALNDDPGHIRFLADLVQQQLQGWPEAEAGYDADAAANAARASNERARALGARK
jgi:ferrochelatase